MGFIKSLVIAFMMTFFTIMVAYSDDNMMVLVSFGFAAMCAGFLYLGESLDRGEK